MKMIMFDFRESEKPFFKQNDFTDFEITFIPEPLNEATQLTEEQLNETDIVCVFINSEITENVINKFKNLRVIATRSTGYNHIDIKYCTQNNISVFNVEEYGQTSVAQFTIMLILALVRKLLPAYLDMKQNVVAHASYEGQNLEGITLGIIGCGAIGSAVAHLAKLLGMNILVYSYMKRRDVSTFAKYTTLDELLEKSDIVSLHLPYSPENYHMIGEKEFKKMKDGVYIINTARGELLDIVALYENLMSGKVQGAALDVLECEYLAVKQDSVVEDIKVANAKCVTSALITQKLLSRNDVIITPHIGYNTQESVETLLEITFNNIRDFYKGMHTNQIC